MDAPIRPRRSPSSSPLLEPVMAHAQADQVLKRVGVATVAHADDVMNLETTPAVALVAPDTTSVASSRSGSRSPRVHDRLVCRIPSLVHRVVERAVRAGLALQNDPSVSRAMSCDRAHREPPPFPSTSAPRGEKSDGRGMGSRRQHGGHPLMPPLPQHRQGNAIAQDEPDQIRTRRRRRGTRADAGITTPGREGSQGLPANPYPRRRLLVLNFFQ